MSTGREVRVYDRQRTPRHWYELMAPTQCAVFLTHGETTAPLTPNGTRIDDPHESTCLIFDRFADARSSCEARVQEFPFMHCEIFDATGKSSPPLLVVRHPSLAGTSAAGTWWKRNRTLVACGLILLTLVLLWVDSRADWLLVFPTVIGINCIFAALRLLLLDFWTGDAERQRQARLEAHVQRESSSAPEERAHDAPPSP